MVTIQRLETGRGIKRHGKAMDAIIRRQLKVIVEVMERRLSGKAASTVNLDFGDMFTNAEEMKLWEETITDVLGESEETMILATNNAAASVAHGVFDKTAILLGYKPPAGAKVGITRKVAGLASEVTNVNNTTRTRLMNRLNRGIFEQNLTTREMVDAIRDDIPSIAGGRVPTIARTEMSRAADIGRIQSVQESGVVTHVSVVGCEAIEDDSPTYMGKHTCNIQNVPAADADKLRFHPNHTGTIIPSRFIDDGGPAPSVANADPVKENQDRPSYDPPENHPVVPPVQADAPITHTPWTDSEKTALHDFSLSGFDYNFAHINQYLSEGTLTLDRLSEVEMAERVGNIDSALAKQPALENKVLYRGTAFKEYSKNGVRIEGFEDLGVGDTFGTAAYQSTSSSLQAVQDGYGSGKTAPIMRIHAKRGVRVSDLEEVAEISSEKEWLLERDAQMRVTKISEEDGIKFIDVEATRPPQ